DFYGFKDLLNQINSNISNLENKLITAGNTEAATAGITVSTSTTSTTQQINESILNLNNYSNAIKDFQANVSSYSSLFNTPIIDNIDKQYIEFQDYRYLGTIHSMS